MVAIARIAHDTAPRPRRSPRQRRAVATRQRVYEAAMSEYARVGIDAARVEDIVEAAGVSWGTFFHYFSTKEDVLLEAAAAVCKAFAGTATAGIDAGEDTASVLRAAFTSLFESAREHAEPIPLRTALLRQVVDHPGRLSAYLGDEIPPPVQVVADVISVGQERGELRSDESAVSLAVVLLHAVLFSTRRGTTLGRPAGISPLGNLALEVVLRGMRFDGEAPPARGVADVIGG